MSGIVGCQHERVFNVVNEPRREPIVVITQREHGSVVAVGCAELRRERRAVFELVAAFRAPTKVHRVICGYSSIG